MGRPAALPESGRIDVWCADRRQPDSVLDRLRRSLSSDEVKRAARLTRDEDQLRFVAGRGILRDLLGRYLRRPPEALRFRYGPHEKPALLEGPEPGRLFFNVAHTGYVSLYGFAVDRELGVDIEAVVADPDAGGIAEREFSPEEAEVLRMMDANHKPLAFTRAWTRKEALLKATGGGLSRPLDSFVVTLEADQPAHVLRVPPDQGPADAWSLHSLTPLTGHVAAVATRGAATLDLRTWRAT